MTLNQGVLQNIHDMYKLGQERMWGRGQLTCGLAEMAVVAATGTRGVRRCTEESPPADVLSGPLGSLSYSGEGAILKE